MKKRIKIIIDVLMTVTLLILMAYQVTGRQFHEYAGAFMLLLFIVHMMERNASALPSCRKASLSICICMI